MTVRTPSEAGQGIASGQNIVLLIAQILTDLLIATYADRSARP